MRSSRIVVHTPARPVRSALIVRSAIYVLRSRALVASAEALVRGRIRRPKFAGGSNIDDPSSRTI